MSYDLKSKPEKIRKYELGRKIGFKENTIGTNWGIFEVKKKWSARKTL